MSEQIRVVVTGLGAISSVGNDVESSWKALVAGKSGIGRVTRFDPSDQRCQIAGEVKDLDLSKNLDPKLSKRMDAFCQYAVIAADEALAQSGIEDGSESNDPSRIGVLISAGIGGLETIVTQAKHLMEAGADRVSPLTVPMMIADMASGQVALKHNFQGANFGIVSACASGLHSIGESYWMIRRGDADVMVAGGAEASVQPLAHAAFGRMKALSCRNDDPERASRPFDKDRDGFVPAEGAGILVLEEREHALRRGAQILAEVVGYGLSCDAYHITAPRSDGSSAAAAIHNALRCAGLTTDAISYINAHGTSTPLNDKTETLVYKLALGNDLAHKIPISSTKSMTGHMLGAAGGFESVVCVKAIQEGVVPPTINQFTPDPDCDLDYVPNVAREMDVSVALKVSFGFGGHNAAVLFKKP